MYEWVTGILRGKEDVPEEGTVARGDYDVAISKLRRVGGSGSKDDLIKEAERHWAVSPADSAVLAVAMAKSSKGKDVVVLEKDKDFEEAIGYMSRTEGSKNVHYVNPYRNVA